MSDDYNFMQLAKDFTDALIKSAEEQVEKAQTFRDQTKELAKIMLDQADAQARQINDMTGRFTEFGITMRDAHLKLNGDDQALKEFNKTAGKPAVSRPPTREAEDNLRTLARLGRTKEENRE